MTTKNPDDSVRNEQFNTEEESIENKGNSENIPDPEENGCESPAAGGNPAEKVVNDDLKEDSTHPAKEIPAGEEDGAATGQDDLKEKEGEEPVKEVIDDIPGEEVKSEDGKDESGPGATEEVPVNDGKVTDYDDSGEEDKTENKEATVTDEELKEDDDSGEGGEAENEEISVDHADLEELPEVDYSGRSKIELVETLELLIENRPLAEIRDDVEKIKSVFYKKHKADNEKLRLKFVEDGGVIEDFKVPEDPLEMKMRALLSNYRGKRTEYSRQMDVEKQENLRRKYDIIDKIKDLVNREESINKTFQEFRDLQNEWHDIGLVPQSAVKNLWETYNHHVEVFYDFIKINKELRDLDFKKNLEKKIRLCEKAEELLLEPNPVNTFRRLQEYHQQWRETGPVPRESRNEVWERFREATSKINKRHHEYFEGQKDEQRKNLDAKTALCEKIDEINTLSITSFKEWEVRAKEVIELQKVWRTIGFAPKKQNTAIYQRFREACDLFFQNKRNFYSENKEVQMENLQKKTELCIAAEALQESTDWKDATEALIKLQKEWKEIGAVPRKFSDKLWKRFRKACDHFFTRKSEHFSELDSSFDENLKLKEALIKKLENFEPGENIKDAFERLNEIQKEWAEIGFVPFKNKDDIINRYRSELNKQFDRLKIDDEQRAIIKYKTKLETLKENPKASRKIRGEREKFLSRIKQLENDIVLWENNIGFFSKSSNADVLIKEVHEKIENAKNTIQMLEEKVRMIDRSGLDD